MLLNNQADPNKETVEGETPLFAACRHGYDACVSLLLDYKADPKKGLTDGMGPMEYSSRAGSVTDGGSPNSSVIGSNQCQIKIIITNQSR